MLTRYPPAALALCALAAAPAAAARPWPDTPHARAEALALLETLNAELLRHDSATLTLDDWCARHHLAENAKVVADRIRGADKPATPEIRRLLKVGKHETVAYRRVRLRCGTRVLSDADNWYVPARLTPAMNRALETSDIAFGRAVHALDFHRQRISARLLWSPLSESRDHGAALRIPAHVIEHRALLLRPDDAPISLVVERYTGEVLDFPMPQAAH